jgi:hypothetical protein
LYAKISLRVSSITVQKKTFTKNTKKEGISFLIGYKFFDVEFRFDGSKTSPPTLFVKCSDASKIIS